MIIEKIIRRIRLFRDPRYVPFFLQRQFKAYSRRESVAKWIAKLKPQFPSSDAHAVTLEPKGIHIYGRLLSDKQVQEVELSLANSKVKDGYDLTWPAFLPKSNERRPECHVAFHEARDVVLTPHLLSLANRPDILATAARFLGCKPTIGYMAAWWSYPTPGKPKEAENFHRDVDDWRFLKLFAYLTEVDENNGPHVYVQDSVESFKLPEIRRFEDSEVEQNFGRDNILTLKAPAGHGFIENTFGIHRGLPPKSARRLIFQVVYCMTSLPYGPRKAVAALNEAQAISIYPLDPYVNRVYLA
jgi:hypothetical protein